MLAVQYDTLQDVNIHPTPLTQKIQCRRQITPLLWRSTSLTRKENRAGYRRWQSDSLKYSHYTGKNSTTAHDALFSILDAA